MKDFPLDWIRGQFPAVAASETVFLDNAAGSQVPRGVADALTYALLRCNANRGGAHRPSQLITERREHVRERIAAFINAPRPGTIAFGPNATSLIGLVADAWRRVLREGDEIVVTGLDHHANVDPWRRLADGGVVVRTWPTRPPEHTLDLADLEALLTPRTQVVAMTAASNTLGTLTDVAAASALAHTAGARLVVDAVHLAPHRRLDVQAMGADVCVFSPYKVFGPHLGVLYLADPLLEELPDHGLEFLPHGDAITWEPGTQNHEAISGFGAVFDYFDELASRLGAPDEPETLKARDMFDAINAHELALCRRMMEGLRALGAELYGTTDPSVRTATVSFNAGDILPGKVAERLADAGIAVAAGHSYAYGLMMRTLGLADRGGAVRASAVHYNSIEDIDRMLDVLKGM